jgi:hypothetical protein
MLLKMERQSIRKLTHSNLLIGTLVNVDNYNRFVDIVLSICVLIRIRIIPLFHSFKWS